MTDRNGTANSRSGRARVVVIGGGIAGACVADHVARETDARVVALERAGDPGGETTAKSGGFVGFWGHESPGCVPLLRYGIRFYQAALSARDAANQLAAEPTTRFQHGGRLRVATTENGDAALRAAFDEWFGRSVSGSATTGTKGAPVQYLSGERLGETFVLPGLAIEEVTGTLYSPGIGHVDDSGALARALLQRAAGAGATVETDAAVTGIDVEDGAVTGVRVDGTTVPADLVVAAAGPWNRRLLAGAGVDIPVRNTRGPILVLDNEGHGLPALFHEETGVYTRQNRDGTRFVGHFPGQYDDALSIEADDVTDTVPDARRESCFDAIDRLCPRAAAPTVVDEWVGIRQVTPDGNPIVGETAVDGLAVVAFNANGIQYAPAAGRIVASRFDSDSPDLPVDAVRADRFEHG